MSLERSSEPQAVPWQDLRADVRQGRRSSHQGEDARSSSQNGAQGKAQRVRSPFRWRDMGRAIWRGARKRNQAQAQFFIDNVQAKRGNGMKESKPTRKKSVPLHSSAVVVE
jgi:hypothetical protein